MSFICEATLQKIAEREKEAGPINLPAEAADFPEKHITSSQG